MTGTTRLQHGDCRKVLAGMPDASIDAVVTDPPYELGFMGKRWDAAGIAYDVAMWAEVLRVLKPGGYLLAFGGTRTYHRMACAIEDAGFEIRDSINWLYGSGFPKSLDVSKAIDKQRDDRADVYKVTAWVRQERDRAGLRNRDIDAAFGFSGMAEHWTSEASQPAVPTLDQVPTLLDVLGVDEDDVPDDVRRLLWDLNGRKGQPGENWARREVIGTRKAVPGVAFTSDGPDELTVTAPATPEAEQWQGWGTALKPAHEPIVVARKPLAGTVAANVLKWGTGALNIDGCRVGMSNADRDATNNRSGQGHTTGDVAYGKGLGRHEGDLFTAAPGGRWPANLVLTHHADCEQTHADDDAVWDCHPECPVAVLDAQSGVSKDGVAVRRNGLHVGFSGARTDVAPDLGYGGSGGASRFFTQTEWNADLDGWSFLYQAKANKRERNAGTPDGNKHPTVKPLALMRWLIRLVTPPGGTVLDPFTGSGTTGIAATLEGFHFIGIEQDDDYIDLAAARISHSQLQTNAISRQAELFDTDGNVT